jgi:hypothetical protein
MMGEHPSFTYDYSVTNLSVKLMARLSSLLLVIGKKNRMPAELHI